MKYVYELGLYYRALLDQGRPLNFMTASFKNTGTRSMLKDVQIPLLNQEANSRLAIWWAKKGKDQEGNQLLLFLHPPKIYYLKKIRTLQCPNYRKVAANTQHWQILRWDGIPQQTMIDPKSLSWLSFLKWD